MSFGGTPRGGYQGGHFSEYQNSTPGSSGRKRYRDEDSFAPNDRGPQRRINDYGSPRGRGRGRGGGGMRGGRGGFRGDRGDDIFDAAAEEDRFCKQVWRLGDSQRFDFRTEIPGIVRAVEDQWLRDAKPVFKAFRVAAVELPHKLPHYALILSMLATSRPRPRTLERQVHTATGVTTIKAGGDQPGEDDAVSLGLEIVRDLVKSFQSHLDSRHWRSTRLTLCFFAHLASLPSPLVTPTSLVALLGSFTAAWEEVMGKAARSDECVRVVGEALLRSTLLSSTGGRIEGVDAVLSSMKTYMASRKLERGLLNDDALASQYDDPLEDLVASLDSAAPVTLLPTLAEPFAPELEARAAASSYPEPLDLPTVLVPPDEDDDDAAESGVGVNGSTTQTNGTRGRRTVPKGPMTPDQKDRTGFGGATLSVEVFVDHSTPSRQLPDGVLLRSLLGDVIDIFEVNRKEAAKVLLEAPKWVSRGTFRPRNQPAPPPPEAKQNGTDEKMEGAESEAPKPPMWSLENTVVEAVLTALFSLPFSPRKSIYYHSLISELCRLSPATVAPALGKCVRRLYAGLGQLAIDAESGQKPASLEAEGVARLAEWFSVHLSNFGFMWGWKDWQDDLSLSAAHPRRVFIARTLELETRLSYFDRVKGTVPETFVEAGVIPADAPAPIYDYDSADNEHRLAAADVMVLMRRKESTARLVEYLDKMKQRLQNDPLCLTEAEAGRQTRDVAVQVLLNIGSRSFSHFLNVLERYTDLLRSLTESTGSRLELLRIVAKFWQTNAQFCGIVIDKLLEYRVVDPIDVVAYVFEGDAVDSPREWSKMHGVDVLMSAVDTVKRRVKGSKKKVAALKKAEENRRDALRAAEIKTDDVAMEEQDEPNKPEAAGDAPTSADDEELAAAEKVLESNRAEQDSVISDVVRRFDKALAGSDSDDEGKEWAKWWLLGWYRSFCRKYCSDLVRYGAALPALELTAGGAGQKALEQAQAWADFAGAQA